MKSITRAAYSLLCAALLGGTLAAWPALSGSDGSLYARGPICTPAQFPPGPNCSCTGTAVDNGECKCVNYECNW
ncbi:MAG TPA: hypothetical protein VF615_07845 [Longimicrobiaceae bacterium]|jgi:hypothetical protein